MIRSKHTSIRLPIKIANALETRAYENGRTQSRELLWLLETAIKTLSGDFDRCAFCRQVNRRKDIDTSVPEVRRFDEVA